MPSQGPNSTTNPSSIFDDAGVGSAVWANPSFAAVEDGSGATVSLGNLEVSHYLNAQEFGFAIPGDATLVGCEVRWKKRCTVGGTVDTRVRLIKDTVVQTGDRSSGAAWPASFTYVTHGSPTDMWDGSWTPADVNSNHFGVAIAVVDATGEASVSAIDHVDVKWYYTAGADPGPVHSVTIAAGQFHYAFTQD